jgi:hypothetical protein
MVVNKKVREVLNRKIKEFQEETAHLVSEVSYAPETIATLLEFCAMLHIIMFHGNKALWNTACNIVFNKINDSIGSGNSGSGSPGNDDMYH